MRKFLLIAVFAVAAITASAQTEQGKMTLGGTILYQSQDSEESSFTILPTFGYFVKGNISIGTGLGYSYSKDDDSFKNSAFVVSPFGRYYKNLSDQFKFFGQVAVPLLFSSLEDEDGNELGESTTIGVALSPGFVFFPTKRFAIELGFNGLTYTNTKVKGGGSSDSFAIGTNFFAPQLGLQFHF